MIIRAYQATFPATPGLPHLRLTDVTFAVPMKAPSPREVRIEFANSKFAEFSRAVGEADTAWVRHVAGASRR